MAFYGKEYKLVENGGNFPAYAKSLGFPADLETSFINSKPVLKIEKDGDSFIQTIKNGEEVYKTTFKSGVESEEAWGEVKVKSTYFVDGNTITHVNVKADGKKFTIKSVFTENDLNETVSGDNFDGTATRYFKAV